MKSIFMTLVVTVCLLVSSEGLYADSGGGCPLNNSVYYDQQEIVNDICPIMGNPVDKDTFYKTVYKGNTIGFCCEACLSKFEEDPENYFNQVQEKE